VSIAVDGDCVGTTAKAILDATPTTIVGRMAEDVIDSTVAQ
jgi:hypothetical protein